MSIGFSISGEFLTEHARNLVLEKRWDHALRTLIDGLDGMTTDIALSILKGDNKLTGVNDIGLTNDTAVEYKTALDYQFSGVFQDGHGRYLRPYAVITAWGKDDIADEDGRDKQLGFNPLSELVGVYSSGTNSRPRWKRQPLVYADNPYTDFAIKVDFLTGQISHSRGGPLGRGEVVICRVVENYPELIYRADRDINTALQKLFDRGVVMNERGARNDDMVEITPKNIAETFAPKSVEELESRLARENQRFADQALAREQELRDIVRYREQIIKQANGDFFPLTYLVKGVEKTVEVPRVPFENWSLWRTAGANLATPWNKISRQGMKMSGDDPYHTDWMLGAGLDLYAMTEDDSTLSEVAFDANFRLQETMMSFDAAVLSGSKIVYGKVVHPKPNEEVASDEIAVIPVANSRYLKAAISAAAVIVERGGEMAHLVSVAREEGVTILRVEDALKKYPVGSRVTVNSQKGSVILNNAPVRDAFGEYD